MFKSVSIGRVSRLIRWLTLDLRPRCCVSQASAGHSSKFPPSVYAPTSSNRVSRGCATWHPNGDEHTCSQSAISVFSLPTCRTRSLSTSTAWPGCRVAYRGVSMGIRRCLWVFRARRARALRRAICWTLGRRRTSIAGYSLRSIAMVARIVSAFKRAVQGMCLWICNHEWAWLIRRGRV